MRSKTSEPEIIRADEKDVPEINAIIQKEFPYVDMTIEKLKERLSNPAISIYKVEKNRRLAAFADFEAFPESIGRITAVAVLEKYRHRGLGKRLVRFSLEKLKEAGCKKILLIAEKGNKGAISLYSKFGFRKIEGSDSTIASHDVIGMLLEL